MARMNTAVQDAIWLDDLAKANGYINIKPLLGQPGKYACIMPLMFTYAIIVGEIGDEGSYDNRWCYHSYEAAKAALDVWQGTGEPQGWHRHPPTGRRRSSDGTEIVAP